MLDLKLSVTATGHGSCPYCFYLHDKTTVKQMPKFVHKAIRTYLMSEKQHRSKQ